MHGAKMYNTKSSSSSAPLVSRHIVLENSGRCGRPHPMEVSRRERANKTPFFTEETQGLRRLPCVLVMLSSQSHCHTSWLRPCSVILSAQAVIIVPSPNVCASKSALNHAQVVKHTVEKNDPVIRNLPGIGFHLSALFNDVQMRSTVRTALNTT